METKEKMIKTDMHIHTSGISFCAHADCQTVIESKIATGYGGMVLTNHCQAWYYPAHENASFMKRVVEEYRKAKSYGERRDFRVFLGIEVTVNDPFYSDWLLYGVTEEFLLNAPCLYQLSQKELYLLCEKHGAVLVQAHPYRSNTGYCDDMRPGELQYLHGLEINCSKGDLERKDEVITLAGKAKKLVTCGTDYHGVAKFCGGTLLPARVQTNEDLAEYLKTTKYTRVFLEEETLVLPTGR